ncbi:hypothetical protein COV61_03530, partial [Candidatus Micrarchaeota archaeon CG11_big_fil_rev_8_21_14_0_20_47_5]
MNEHGSQIEVDGDGIANEVSKIRKMEQESAREIEEAGKKAEKITHGAKEGANEIMQKAQERAVAEKNKIIQYGKRRIEEETEKIVHEAAKKAKELR